MSREQGYYWVADCTEDSFVPAYWDGWQFNTVHDTSLYERECYDIGPKIEIYNKPKG